MKIKHFIIAGVMALSSIVGIFATTKPTFAFNADNDCPHASLYWSKRIYETNYPKASEESNKKWNEKYAGKEYKGPAPKDAGDIKNINDCNLAKTEHDMMNTLTVVINVIVGLVGFIAVVMIVIGGIGFATSQGDPAKTAKGKNTLIFGIVGLIVSLLAFAIVNFVLKNVFSSSASDAVTYLQSSEIASQNLTAKDIYEN